MAAKLGDSTKAGSQALILLSRSELREEDIMVRCGLG